MSDLRRHDVSIGPEHDRLMDLLADEATVGLSEHEHAELEALCLRHTDVPRECMQLAAANLDVLLFSGPASRLEPMPEHVRARIAPPPTRAKVAVDADRDLAAYRLPQSPVLARSSRLGWLAAAACLGLAVIGWWPRLAAGPSDYPVAGVARIESLAAVDRLKASAGDVLVTRFDRGPDPTAAASEAKLYWSPSRQEGYMVFRGLKANDPRVEQYQLWIFDPERDERHPVHGGVFDIPVGQETVVVKVEPRLTVPKANTFVVTVERPGGVWVSDRKRIPAIAKLSS